MLDPDSMPGASVLTTVSYGLLFSVSEHISHFAELAAVVMAALAPAENSSIEQLEASRVALRKLNEHNDMGREILARLLTQASLDKAKLDEAR